MSTQLIDYLSFPENPNEIFQLNSFIGQGTFGSVFHAKHMTTKEDYAVKIIKSKEKNNLKKEIGFMKELIHCENIVKYHGSYPFKSDKTIWLVLEYCELGSMNEIIKTIKRNFTEDEIASIIEMVLKGLNAMHEKRIIHRDVKGSNILLTKEGVAKLGDFGVSTKLYTSYNKVVAYSPTGSPYWMSPEVIMKNEYNQSTDIWSLGITCLELAEGAPPLSDIKPRRAMMLIPNENQWQSSLKNKAAFSDDFNDFIRKCLVINPDQRSKAIDLLNHPFILKKRRFDSLEKLIKLYEKMKNENEDNESLSSIHSLCYISKRETDLEKKYNEIYKGDITIGHQSIIHEIEKEEKNDEGISLNNNTLIIKEGEVDESRCNEENNYDENEEDNVGDEAEENNEKENENRYSNLSRNNKLITKEPSFMKYKEIMDFNPYIQSSDFTLQHKLDDILQSISPQTKDDSLKPIINSKNNKISNTLSSNNRTIKVNVFEGKTKMIYPSDIIDNKNTIKYCQKSINYSPLGAINQKENLSKTSYLNHEELRLKMKQEIEQVMLKYQEQMIQLETNYKTNNISITSYDPNISKESIIEFSHNAKISTGIK